MANLFQLPVVLATDPINGVPLSGGKLTFYKNNTSTKKDTYTTPAKTTPHSNPVVADSGGYFPEIWLDGTYSWKLTDSDEVLIDEGDDLSGMVDVLISNVFHKVNTFDGGIIVDPEHATDSGTDAFVSATNTTKPGNGKTIVRDFQSANTTTTPTLDSLTITTKDGSALWAGALSGVHTLQLASGGGSWLVLDPLPIDEDDMASDSDAAVPTQQSTRAFIETILHNYALNPHFDVWQAGTSFTFTAGGDPSGYTADGWVGDCDINSGTTGECTISQQSFTLGQTDVPGEPEFFLRHNQTAAAENGANLEQRLEGVIAYANQTIAWSFYARVSSGTLTVTPRAQQVFGSGGSSRVDVTANEGGITVTTDWQRFTRTFDMPSISGKTIGAESSGSGPSTDFSLVQPSGETYTLDVAQCKIEIGNVSTPVVREEPFSVLSRCKRYFERFRTGADAEPLAVGFCVDTDTARTALFYQEKYVTPTISINDASRFEVDGAGIAETVSNITTGSPQKHAARINWNVSGTPLTAGEGVIIRSQGTSEAILDVSARV